MRLIKFFIILLSLSFVGCASMIPLGNHYKIVDAKLGRLNAKIDYYRTLKKAGDISADQCVTLIQNEILVMRQENNTEQIEGSK